MEDLKNEFVAMSALVIADNQALAKEPLSMKEMFCKRNVEAHRRKVDAHFVKLADLDQRYSNHLRTRGTINDLLMLNAQIQILTLSRTMVTGALKNYEASMTEFEGQLNFRLSTTLAVIALLVSVVSIGV